MQKPAKFPLKDSHPGDYKAILLGFKAKPGSMHQQNYRFAFKIDVISPRKILITSIQAKQYELLHKKTD